MTIAEGRLIKLDVNNRLLELKYHSKNKNVFVETRNIINKNLTLIGKHTAFSVMVDGIDGRYRILMDMLVSDDSSGSDLFGNSIAISDNGDIIAVGAPMSDSHGCVYIFKSNEDRTVWNKVSILTSNKISEFLQFGGHVSINDKGNILAVSCTKNTPSDNPEKDRILIFKYIDEKWHQSENYISIKNLSVPSGLNINHLKLESHFTDDDTLFIVCKHTETDEIISVESFVNASSLGSAVVDYTRNKVVLESPRNSEREILSNEFNYTLDGKSIVTSILHKTDSGMYLSLIIKELNKQLNIWETTCLVPKLSLNEKLYQTIDRCSISYIHNESGYKIIRLVLSGFDSLFSHVLVYRMKDNEWTINPHDECSMMGNRILSKDRCLSIIRDRK